MQKSLLNFGGNQSTAKAIMAMVYFLAFAYQANAQRTVTGKVLSGDDQSPLPGVNIILKGTTIGTITDVDGTYSLGVSSDADVLAFSFVGFTTTEEAVGTRSAVNIFFHAKVFFNYHRSSFSCKCDKSSVGNNFAISQNCWLLQCGSSYRFCVQG